MSGPWREVMKNITDRFDLCAAMELEFVEKPEGCKALSKLIKEMADIIDTEITVRRTRCRALLTPSSAPVARRAPK